MKFVLTILTSLILTGCIVNPYEPPPQGAREFMSLQILGCLVQNCLSTTANPSNGTAPVISNAKDKGTVHSGFLVGTGSGKITISIDSGNPQSVTQSGSNWSYKLPTGSNTWRRGSSHTVKVSNGNGSTKVTLRKGINQDANGDGYADVIVGATGVNSGKGAVYIFLSQGQSGLRSIKDTSANTILTGTTTNGSFGSSPLLSDLNGDGYADAVVGAPDSSASTAGKVYAFLSSGSGGIASGSDTSASSILSGITAGDRFGISIAGGDTNGDGYDDIIVCAFGVNSNSGAVYSFLGNSANGINSVSASSAHSTLSGTFTGSSFGGLVATGDVNGDKYADILVSAEYAGSNNGKGYLFLSSGFAGITSKNDTAANSIFSGTVSANLSFWCTIGDINGDGYDDVVISDAIASTYYGTVYIFYSQGSTGFSSALNDTGANSKITGLASNANFGYGLSTGDLNGDSYSDLIVGADQENSNNGAAYIFDSQGSSGIASQSFTGANTVLSGTSSGGKFGSSVFFSDPNGDGFADAIIGATNDNSAAGAAFLFTSSGTSGIASSNDAGASSTLTGTSASGSFGSLP